MFFRINNTIGVDLANFDSSKITNMASMFERCYYLE